MIPESGKLMDLQLNPFSVAEDIDLRPFQVGVLKHGGRSRQPFASLPEVCLARGLPGSREGQTRQRPASFSLSSEHLWGDP